MELKWAQVKGGVAGRNKTFKLADVQRLANGAIDKIGI
jgi:hypothetical protein